MPQSATLPTGGGAASGLDNIPTPVKIALIGGGLGLAVFLWRKSQSGGGTTEQDGSVLPNTTIMLGSLQQEMLDLKGQVGYGDLSIENLMAGGFGNIGSMIDSQTAAFQAGLTDVQKAVIDNQNANTKSILDSLSARSDLLTELITNNSGAEAAAFKAFQDSISTGLGAIAAQQNAEMAAIGALGDTVTTSQKDIIERLTGLQKTTTGLAVQGEAISKQVAGVSAQTDSLGRFMGWQFYQIPNRYAAYIPGQSAGNYGGNVIGSV